MTCATLASRAWPPSRPPPPLTSYVKTISLIVLNTGLLTTEHALDALKATTYGALKDIKGKADGRACLPSRMPPPLGSYTILSH